MSENHQENDVQDPAEPKRVDVQQDVEPQPTPVTPGQPPSVSEQDQDDEESSED